MYTLVSFAGPCSFHSSFFVSLSWLITKINCPNWSLFGWLRAGELGSRRTGNRNWSISAMDGEILHVSCPEAWMKKPLNHQCGRPTNMKRMFEDLSGLRQQHIFEVKQNPIYCLVIIGVILHYSTQSGWWLGPFFIFPYIGNFIIPTDELIFFRGVGIPPSSWGFALNRFCESSVLPTDSMLKRMEWQR